MDVKVPVKRKRKESLLRKAKKYQKRVGSKHGGHGTHIDQDVFQYFCRVLDVWNKGFDSEEDKRMFADNVLEQTKGSEMELATSQLTSRAIDTVVEAASTEKVKNLESAMMKDLRKAFVDRFCSHLTQKLILASAKRISTGEEEEEDPFAIVCIKFAINNVEEFVWHVCACHVVRSCVEALPVMGDKMPQEFPKLFYGTLIEAPTLADICKMELGSGLLQVLIRNLNKTKPKLCQKTVNHLLKHVFAPQEFKEDNVVEDTKIEDKEQLKNEVAPVFKTQPLIRLLECAIECSSSKHFTQIYAALFINRLGILARDRSANKAVQALIKASQEKSEFESIFDELVDGLKDILKAGHSGILVGLASSCQRLSTRQGQFIHALLRCLDCSENELDLVPRCISLDSFVNSDETLRKSAEGHISVSLAGSLIVQSLLNFQKPIKVINSLLNMDTDKLVSILSDPRGCHITDAFFSAQYVGEKSKDKLFHKIKDNLVDLVISKHGSRSFDAVWNGVGIKHRQKAAAALNERESVVTGSQFGRIIASKIHLSSYRRDPKAWVSIFSLSNNPQKLFSDIIGKA